MELPAESDDGRRGLAALMIDCCVAYWVNVMRTNGGDRAESVARLRLSQH
jgi:hypothetical protein